MEFTIEQIISIVITIGGLVGVYVKMNGLIVRQDVKISHLESEIKEMKRHNEKMEEKIFTTLEDIKVSVVDIKLHFSSCVNFKTNK